MIEYNTVYKSVNYGDFVVLSPVDGKPRQRYLIRFTGTGHTKIAKRSAIVGGNVKDPYYKSILGVACIGNAKDVMGCRFYRAWRNMLDRVYSSTRHNFNSYKDVKIADRWHCFEYFLKDVTKLPEYDRVLFDAGLIQLDKDAINKDAKLYSLETCSWITSKQNIDLRDTSNYRRHFSVYLNGKLLEKDIGLIAASKLVGTNTTYLLKYASGSINKKGYTVIEGTPIESVTTIPTGSSE